MSALGSNIKFLREHHNITPLAMSKKLKISLQDYNAWESGLSLPTISNVMDVCAVYGLKNPTDLFSENFIQIYNSSEIQTAKQVAKRKAEARRLAEESETKLNFVVKEGSYYGNGNFFNISICLAIAVLVSLFMPCFVIDGVHTIGYLAVSANVFAGIMLYFIAGICLFVIFAGVKANYKIVEGNEFMTRGLAIFVKLLYIISGLLVGALALAVYFTATAYEYGLTVITACSLIYMVYAMMSAASIKLAGKDVLTYTYVIKFAKYKLRTNAPRRILKIISIISLILLVAITALAVVQLIMDQVLIVDQLGLNTGLFNTITIAFYEMLPYLTGTLFQKIVVGLIVATLFVVHISNIIASNKVKVTDYNGYLEDKQTNKIRKHVAINFALNIIAYVMAYALIIVSLLQSAASVKLVYQYYLIPILTVFALLIAIKFIIYPKVYGAFRGAETYEVTGFSEVKLDEEKKQKKLDKKGQKEKKEKAPEQTEQQSAETNQQGGNQ
jgi:transcriptional regulator with XRE-family HTH domain